MNDKIAVGEAGKDFQKLARTVLETPEPAAKKAAAKVKETAEKVRLETKQLFPARLQRPWISGKIGT